VERILCLDYGKVRTGIAVTDPLQIIVSPLETVSTHDLKNFLDHYFRCEKVKIIVVGYPLQLNGTKSDTTIMVDDFIGLLKKWYPTKKVDVIDERLSSIEANNIIIRSGVKKSKRKKKGLIDKISAVILLQSYLERNKK
jgi:putative Holliday junction resolvase